MHGAAATGPATGAAEPPRVHGDGVEVERNLLEASRAFIREDLRGVKTALDRVAEAFPGLRVEDEAQMGESVVSYDRAFRATVNRTREMAAGGHLDRAFDQHVWIHRTCRLCHAAARDAGLEVRLGGDSLSRRSGAVSDPGP